MGVLPTDAVQFAKTLLNRDKTRISMREVGKLSFVASVCPSASASMEVAFALRKAKALTQEFKERVDPTVQHSLDELPQRLQSQTKHGSGPCDNSDAAPSWFSETPQHTKALDDGNTIIARRASRHSTHSGVSLCVSLKDLNDFDSDGSTRAPTPVEEASTPLEEAMPRLPQAAGLGKRRSPF